ncbi:hypothetical protein [Bradyrhizobium sp. AZCC 1693]|uniref:hypothetical protein n=1 Tax=Bradyrhizobium sp. AZCC 1693 TaxID=3117029 RepID=UPI002FEEE598
MKHGDPSKRSLEHDPEKWIPVFRKDHAQIKEIERDGDSKKRRPALILFCRNYRPAGEAVKAGLRGAINRATA